MRGGSMGGDFQQIMPLTYWVKRLLIVNVVMWFVGAVVVEQYLLSQPYLTLYLSLLPEALIRHFFFWQPFTYMFFHSPAPLPIMFNSLLLWWLGSELERQWGSRFFLLYYMVTGVGSAFLYVLSVVGFSLITSKVGLLTTPIQGASGAIFGLLLAYGLVFGERIVYFMFFFPMKAKWFVAVLGGLEVVMILNAGFDGGGVANLAHLTGIASGWIFLQLWKRSRRGGRGSGDSPRKGEKKGKLKLVVNNPDEFNAPEKPKYWN